MAAVNPTESPRRRVLRKSPDVITVSSLGDAAKPNPRISTLVHVFENLAPEGAEFSLEALSSVFGRQFAEHGRSLRDMEREHGIPSGTLSDVARALGFTPRSPSEAAYDAMRDDHGKFISLTGESGSGNRTNGKIARQKPESRSKSRLSAETSQTEGGEELIIMSRVTVPPREQALSMLEPYLRVRAVGEETPDQTAERVAESFSRDSLALEEFTRGSTLREPTVIALFHAVLGEVALAPEAETVVYVRRVPPPVKNT